MDLGDFFYPLMFLGILWTIWFIVIIAIFKIKNLLFKKETTFNKVATYLFVTLPPTIFICLAFISEQQRSYINYQPVYMLSALFAYLTYPPLLVYAAHSAWQTIRKRSANLKRDIDIFAENGDIPEVNISSHKKIMQSAKIDMFFGVIALMTLIGFMCLDYMN